MKRRLSTRRQVIVRAAIYGFMSVVIVTIVSLLTFAVLGYQFNQRDGRFEQGGLLQFGSVPQGARVTLDELRLGTTTNTKTTVDVGSHSVSYNLDGYRTWRKTIAISPGQVGWLNYARLIPTSVTPQNLRTFPALSGALASPQHKYMLLHQDADQPVFVLANIQGDTVRYSELALPAGSFTEPTPGTDHSFTLDSWSRNEESVLIRHTYDDGQLEWILLDRSDTQNSININANFGITPNRVQFAGTGDRLLFVQTDAIVRRINLDDQTLSRPLASRIETFTAYDDKTITYTTAPDVDQKRTVGYAAVDIRQPVTITTYPADGQPLMATMATYFNKRHLVVLHGQQLKIQSGTLPTDDRPGKLKDIASQTVPPGAGELAISNNSRFIVMRLQDGFATYDIDLMKYDKTTWATQSASPRPINWLDDFIIWSDHGGQLRFYEFDGANQQNIMPVTEGYSVSVSPGGKYVYGVLQTDNGFEFQRAQLVRE